METFLEIMGANWQTIAILALSFIILVFILSKFLFKPLLKYIDERNNEIKKTYEGIEKSKEEITQLKDKYQAELSEIEKKAYDKMQAAIKEGLALKSDIISEAHSQADNVLRKAAQEIDVEKKKALAELKGEIVNLSIMAAGRVIEQKMDEAANNKIVERFLDEIETTKEPKLRG